MAFRYCDCLYTAAWYLPIALGTAARLFVADVIKHHGSTDPLILLAVLEHHGVPLNKASPYKSYHIVNIRYHLLVFSGWSRSSTHFLSAQSLPRLKEMEEAMNSFFESHKGSAGAGLCLLPGIHQLLSALKVTCSGLMPFKKQVTSYAGPFAMKDAAFHIS